MLGGYFSHEASYDRGAQFLGAHKDTAGADDGVPMARFNKVKMASSWSRPFMILIQRCAFSINVSAQYGLETLYPSEQYSIGDYYTVRGFKNYSASGDRGYCVRSEIAVNDFSRFWNHLQGLGFFSGFDYGYVIDKTGKRSNGGRGEAALAGVSAGIRYSKPLITIHVTFGMRVKSPDFIKENRHVVYFAATTNLTNLYSETWNTMITKANVENTNRA
jgi:hemolysin activation/secretion protein